MKIGIHHWKGCVARCEPSNNGVHEPRLVSRSYGVVCLRIGPTTGRLTWSPDSHSLLRTVWPEILTFAKPDVLRAVSSAVIIRFWRWIRRICLSWRCEVTRDLPLRGLSFVLPVCRRRIASLEMVILDTLKWSATIWWIIPAWTIPTDRSRKFWRSRGSDVLVKILIF